MDSTITQNRGHYPKTVSREAADGDRSKRQALLRANGHSGSTHDVSQGASRRVSAGSIQIRAQRELEAVEARRRDALLGMRPQQRMAGEARSLATGRDLGKTPARTGDVRPVS